MAEQSVTSRLETSRYRDFSQFFESIGLGLENLGLEKKSRIGLENIWSQKKSWYRSRKDLVSKKSLSIGLENFGLKKVSVSVSKTLVSKKVLAMLISFSKEIQVILLMILSHKEFQYQSQKFWSHYWS